MYLEESVIQQFEMTLSIFDHPFILHMRELFLPGRALFAPVVGVQSH